jgi:hypothetical protein
MPPATRNRIRPERFGCALGGWNVFDNRPVLTGFNLHFSMSEATAFNTEQDLLRPGACEYIVPQLSRSSGRAGDFFICYKTNAMRLAAGLGPRMGLVLNY